MSRTGEPATARSSPDGLGLLDGPTGGSRTTTSTAARRPARVTGRRPECSTMTPSAPALVAAYGGPGPGFFQPPGPGVAADEGRGPPDGFPRRRAPRAPATDARDHGSRDTLIDPSGGRRTAELVPGARYLRDRRNGPRLPARSLGAVGRRLVGPGARPRPGQTMSTTGTIIGRRLVRSADGTCQVPCGCGG